MAEKTLTINLPSEILVALNESEKELITDMKLFTAIRYYEMNKLTIGKAADMAGLSRYDFECILSDNGISISNLDKRDIENDIKKLELLK